MRRTWRIAHEVKVFEVHPEGFPERGHVIVRDAPFLARIADNWCNSRVMVLRDGREEVVLDLIVEVAAEEGHHSRIVIVIDTCDNLYDCPFLTELVREFRVQREERLSRDVADLEIEGEEVSTRHFRENVSSDNRPPRSAKEQARQHEAQDDVPGLARHQIGPISHTERIDAYCPVRGSTISVGKVLQAELECEKTVKNWHINMLPGIKTMPKLAMNEEAQVAFTKHRQVRVDAHDIGINMMTENMLMMPSFERCASKPVHGESTNRLPPSLVVTNG